MPRARTYQTEAIVIKKTKLGDADRILTLYTPDLGKIQGVAKGIRRPRARLAGHLELLTHSMVSLVHGRNLDTIIGSQTIESFLPLKFDLELGACALYATELVGQFATERQENRTLFALLLEVMQQLSGTIPYPAAPRPAEVSPLSPSPDGHRPDTFGLLRRFEIHLLHEVGYRPQLWQCVACRHPLPNATNYFSSAAGGVLCSNCRHKQSFVYPLSADTLSVLRTLQEGDWSSACELRCDATARYEVEVVMRHYLRYLLERDIRSAAWLDTLTHLEAQVSDLKAPI
jgi:DNA repair protein RecO (recombination protein O)